MAEEQNLDESFSAFMAEVEGGVHKLIRESSKAPADAYEAWQAFSHAIDWTENWIRGMLACHVVIFLIVLIFRKNANMQIALFLSICLLVRLAEYINAYCANHWEEFSSQNYFDKNGVFAGTLFAAPLLLIAFAQLINFLVLTSSALITAKRLEIKVKSERQKRWQEAQEVQSSAPSNAAAVESSDSQAAPGSNASARSEAEKETVTETKTVTETETEAAPSAGTDKNPSARKRTPKKKQ